MYAITAVLFLIPLSILGIAWRGELRKGRDAAPLDWRSYCLRLALVAGVIATLAAMVSSLSWTHSGGSPHGLMPPPGLWLTFRPIVKWSIVTTVAIGALAKGKGRLLAIGSAISVVFVIFLLAALEMD
jgi:hypothetical protein